MRTAECYEPDDAILKSPWLNVAHARENYAPRLLRIRRRSFTADIIRSLDLGHHAHRHTVYHLIYYLKGRNTITIDQHPVAVRHGQLVCIDPNVFHNVVPHEQQACVFLTLMFCFETRKGTALKLPFAALLRELSGQEVLLPQVVDDRGGRLRWFFSCLEQTALKSRSPSLPAVGYALVGLLNELASLGHQPTAVPVVPDDMESVRKYLLANLANKVSIQDLLPVAKLSRSHLLAKFKQTFGHSPIDYLIRERVDRAKLYLSYSSKRNKEIAALCGLNSEYYFNRIFKSHTGMTPGAFRRATHGLRRGGKVSR